MQRDERVLEWITHLSHRVPLVSLLKQATTQGIPWLFTDPCPRQLLGPGGSGAELMGSSAKCLNWRVGHPTGSWG